MNTIRNFSRIKFSAHRFYLQDPALLSPWFPQKLNFLSDMQRHTWKIKKFIKLENKKKTVVV